MEVRMTLKPTDMLEIQSAIDAYERKFPHRPPPTPEVALAWRLGKKAWAKRQAAARMAEATGEDAPGAVLPSREKSGDSLKPTGNALMWLLRQVRLRFEGMRTDLESSGVYEDSAPLVQSVLKVGFWGVAAVLVVSVFLLGAVVGGFK
jgi:hypothetical protein